MFYNNLCILSIPDIVLEIILFYINKKEVTKTSYSKFLTFYPIEPLYSLHRVIDFLKVFLSYKPAIFLTFLIFRSYKISDNGQKYTGLILNIKKI